jgi:hypothetical protein
MPLPWPNKLMFEISGQSILALPDPDHRLTRRKPPMRKKKPVHALIDQVRITRDGNDAIIEYADPEISGTRLTIGPQIGTMTDREIVDVFNGAKAALEGLLPAWNKTVVEIQPGKRQIQYHKETGEWVPRGDVLRCVIDDDCPDGAVTIHIDNDELSLDDFGRLLRSYAGWGMRIAFVPEDSVTENPKVEIREPNKRD